MGDDEFNFERNAKLAPASARAGEDDARGEHRRRVLLTGIVAYADLSISFRCSIINISSNGAQLRLPLSAVTPARFWLIDVASSSAKEAIVIWKTYPNVGVGFLSSTDLGVASQEPLQRRLRALWLEAAPHRA